MKTFELKRKNGLLIPNEYDIQNRQYLGIILSGINYTYRNPILHYSKKLLLQKEFDYAGFDFKYYDDPNARILNDEEKNRYFEDDVNLICSKILELAEPYKKIILIGKSLGTSAIQRFLKEKRIREKASLVYITPGHEWSQCISELITMDNPLLVIGSFEDQYYPVSNLSDLYNRKNLSLYEIKQGNHSLETRDVLHDIDTLKQVMIKISTFIDQWFA